MRWLHVGGTCVNFKAHDKGHNINVPVVRTDTSPTPGTQAPQNEHPDTPITSGALVEPVVIPSGGSPEPSEGRSSPATPDSG